MNQIDLSVLIPARNEEFLDLTIKDVLDNIEGKTEVIAVLDGYLPDPPLTQNDPRVTIIYLPESLGQRAATNRAAKIAKGKYVMKLDAHCAVDKGFDVKMLQAFKEVGDDVTMIPTMRNLHVFDWVCPDGHRRYQGRSGVCIEQIKDEDCQCEKQCGKPTVKEVVWRPKPSPQSVAFRFDKTMHFQYWGAWGNQQKGDLIETMSIQGSCFMITKEKYWEWDVCSETDFNSWGQQGVEVACKTWLSGGRVLCNRRTWYAQMFRTQGGDFGFPYPNPESKIKENREKSRYLFQHDNWPKAKRKFQWILDHFNPPDWGLTKGIIFYTDNELRPEIAKPVIERLVKIADEKKMPIVTAALHKRLDFGAKNIYFPSLKRGMLTQFKQILGALENSTADIIFFCEADILYHPTHFDFNPPEDKREVYYYNVNVWKVDWFTGHALKVDDLKQLSGFVGYRDFLIRHYKKRIEIVEQRIKDMKEKGMPIENQGVSHYMGFEPGMHSEPRGVDNFPTESWRSELPNIDIRHDRNISKNRWKKEEFQDQKYTVGWTESTADKIPGWEIELPRVMKGEPSKGIIYYTDNELDEKISKPVQEQLVKIRQQKNIPIVTAALKRRLKFGDKNIFFPSLKRSYYAMFKQILGALENSDADIIYFAEHDVLYDPSHFDFTPPREDTFYYNQNVWYVRAEDGHALHYDVNQLSGLCGYRKALINHFKERLDRVAKEGFTRNMGFEPFTHGRVQWETTYKYATWKSPNPNIDIRYGANSTGMRWKKEEYRNQQLLINWQESTVDRIPGWNFSAKDFLSS